MGRLTLEEAHLLYGQLDKVRRTAIRNWSAGSGSAPTSPPLDELRCLISGAGHAGHLEGQLLTVGRMALGHVGACVYTRRWDIGAGGARTFPHNFQRLVEPDPRAHPGDAYPYLLLRDVQWADGGNEMPSQVWITHREVRLAQGSLEDRASRAIAHRYSRTAISWSLRTAIEIDGYEEREEYGA